MKDYQHAAKLFLADGYALAPKFGFIYYVVLNINSRAVLDQQWNNRDKNDVGLLAKQVDLPKFKISTETLNQYNRKTVVQTKLNYDPISIQFHDDNAGVTHNLWVNYFKHYYADSNQDDRAFSDTKFSTTPHTYGRYYDNERGEFFSSIDIYVLHRGEFTQFTLVNPKISDWQHDAVSQDAGNKILQNKMTVAFETVKYQSGIVSKGSSPPGWADLYYDNDGSPNKIGGKDSNLIFGSANRGASTFDLPGKGRVYGRVGGPYSSPNPLLSIASILAKNYVNQKGLSRQGPVGYNIGGGVLGALGNAGAGKYAEPPPNQNQPGILNLPGGVGINIFKGLNTSVDGSTRVNPAAIILPPRG
jgi:hypothetical protein